MTDDEILEAYRLLAQEEGIFAEPASAACVAGLLQTAKRQPEILHDKTVVCIITGHGLKDPDAALRIEAEMADVPAELEAVEGAMGLR